METQFDRERMLLGDEALEILSASHVAVFGVGGVGSFAAEALARAGVGAITLVDHDEVSLTNLNRQAEAATAVAGVPTGFRYVIFHSQTTSLCETCLVPVPAKVIIEDECVFCPLHHACFVVEVGDTATLKSTISRLRGIDAVFDAYRVTPTG